MRLKSASLLLISLLMVTSLATAEPVSRNIFTLQVASFPEPDSAKEFAARLTRNGVQAVWRPVALPGKGIWNRVSVGLFRTSGEARSLGESLVAQGLIREFIVKQINESESPLARNVVTGAPGRKNVVSGRENFSNAVSYAQLDGAGVIPLPRSLLTNATGLSTKRLSRSAGPRSSGTRDPNKGILEDGNRPRWASERSENEMESPDRLFRSYAPAGLLLPSASPSLSLARTTNPTVATTLIPRPDPVKIALRIVAGKGKGSADLAPGQGGLWLSGDTAEGLARLRWIAGSENTDLIAIDRDGRVGLDQALLARLTRVEKGGAAATLRVVNYLLSNEGLMLLVQLTQGVNRYRLHLGPLAPTAGGGVKVAGSLNLDNNFDSRINPYRRLYRKLDLELPPEGFEALIAMNPQARWFNLPSGRFVPVGHITFHELAEAYAKVQLGLDYLVQEPKAGAHNMAIERERILKLQRPSSDVVVTAGSNRMLRLGEEMRRFYSEPRASISGFRQVGQKE